MQNMRVHCTKICIRKYNKLYSSIVLEDRTIKILQHACSVLDCHDPRDHPQCWYSVYTNYTLTCLVKPAYVKKWKVKAVNLHCDHESHLAILSCEVIKQNKQIRLNCLYPCTRPIQIMCWFLWEVTSVLFLHALMQSVACAKLPNCNLPN